MVGSAFVMPAWCALPATHKRLGDQASRYESRGYKDSWSKKV